jgi:hypothetical protein
MHAPERWAILQFSTDAPPPTTSSQDDHMAVYYKEWPSRAAVMAIYNAEYAYYAINGAFTSSYQELLPYSAPPFPICPTAIPNITLSEDSLHFVIDLASPDGSGIVATVRDDRYLTVSFP